jgi:hypothetical protein
MNPEALDAAFDIRNAQRGYISGISWFSKFVTDEVSSASDVTMAIVMTVRTTAYSAMVCPRSSADGISGWFMVCLLRA